jgi:hypothetical protein
MVEKKTVDGIEIDWDPETGKATPTSIRKFFGPNGEGKELTTRELMALKKDPDKNDLPDYDQIARGIGTGSLTY